MSKINNLIKELCPNGVENVSLGSLMNRIKEKNYDDSGIEIVYSVTKEKGIVKSDDLHDFNVYSSDLSNYNILRKDQYAYNPARLNIGSIARLKSDEVGLVSPMYIVFELDQNKIGFEYFEHLLFSEKVFNDMCSFVEQGARFRFDYKNWDKVIIDLPPLNVQKEIVKILNKFKDLEYELQLELDARKSQYEFWRGQMFKHKGNSKISDLFKRVKGTPITAGKMKEIEEPDGEIRIFAGGKTVVNANLEDIPKANIISYPCVIVQSRGLIDFVYYDKPFTFKNEMWAYTCDNQVTVKYLYYYLKNNINYFREIGTQMGSMPQISLPVTEKFEIYLPSLEEQKKVVNILDKFDALVNDITVGLPAEIELRRKQYEYYRNKLLSFEELSVSE